MKLLSSKAVISSVLLSCTMLFTVNASAKEVSLEHYLAATVQAQGQKAERDLSAELANTIKAELRLFSMRYSTVETQVLVAKQTKLSQLNQQSLEE
jgi:hypothetical protein